jgi:hypothetical protein
MQAPVNLNPRAVNMLEGLRSFLINNPNARSALAGVGSAAAGYAATRLANNFIPDESGMDIDPGMIAAGAGVYGAMKGGDMIGSAIRRSYTKGVAMGTNTRSMI